MGREDLFYPVLLCILATLIYSASVRSIPFLSFIEPINAWNVPFVSLIFLKRSLVFPILVFLYFFALITEEGFHMSPCYSLELYIQMGISFLFSFAFHFSFFTAIVRPPQTAILLFCISFSWGWSCSLSPVQCHKLLYEQEEKFTIYVCIKK